MERIFIKGTGLRFFILLDLNNRSSLGILLYSFFILTSASYNSTDTPKIRGAILQKLRTRVIILCLKREWMR